jgi:hypothetical protein
MDWVGNHLKLGNDSWIFGWDLKPKPSAYESGVLQLPPDGLFYLDKTENFETGCVGAAHLNTHIK